MDTRKNMIIAKGKVITKDVISCCYNSYTHKYDLTFKNGRMYSYHCDNIRWLRKPQVLNHLLLCITYKGYELLGISEIYVFKDKTCNYWHVIFEDQSEQDYRESELQIIESVLRYSEAKDVFVYLRQCAELCPLKTDDGARLLSNQYRKIGSVRQDTALAAYLYPKAYQLKPVAPIVPIFPFGCNSSQFKAVKNALENQVSVIEGPPGTGKTQTILNVMANLLVLGKTAQIVSNNNAAIQNIYQKLASSQYQMDFVVASLGRIENKKDFIDSQNGLYPDLSSWYDEETDTPEFMERMKSCGEALGKIFLIQEQIAGVKQELRNVKTEQRHFKKYLQAIGKDEVTARFCVPSSWIMQLLVVCQDVAEQGRALSIFLKMIIFFFYGRTLYNNGIDHVVATIQASFYQAKIAELRKKRKAMEKRIKSLNANTLIDEFREMSLRLLRNNLYRRYGKTRKRRVFSESDLWKTPQAVQKEYPIVLSTTFSARSSLGESAVFDYVIVDEASQVDVATGALALSNARCAVIVGDSKQLQNVVSESDVKRADAIFDTFCIPKGYSFAHRSFLQSICEMIPYAPKVLLREHYRCHPKIIAFCNQKFYNNELIIMTEDNGEKNTLSVVKTVEGDHARGHFNQRQIDVISGEILPKIDCLPEEIGIIAPYNDQVNAMKRQVPDKHIDVATVHKFQGREKEAIILTTVDNKITAFADDPYLLNVAVSRARKELWVVISSSRLPEGSNIGDLVAYAEYQNFSVSESKVYSIFDYLYSQYTERRLTYLKKYKKVSEYDSENLIYTLITETLIEMGINECGVVCHQPLNALIRNWNLMNEAEQRYAANNATHLDFLIFSHISKKALLAVEVDGYAFHREGTKQFDRDRIKDQILGKYEIPIIRFPTNGSGEKEKLKQKLQEILKA